MDSIGMRIEQLLTAGAAQGSSAQSANKGKKPGDTGFDAMLQQKQQATDSAPRQDGQPQAAGAENTEPTLEQREMAAALTATPQQVSDLLAGLNLQTQAVQTVAAAPVQTAEQGMEALAQQAQSLAGQQMGQVEEASLPTQAQTEQAAQSTEAPRTERTVRLEATAEPRTQAEQAVQSTLKQPVQQAQSAEQDDGGQKEAQTDMGGSAPLFQQVEAVPVKVAQPEAAPVPLEAENGPEQLASQIANAAEQGETRLEIMLEPANLGKVRVEIARAGDGRLSVVLSALNPRTAAILDQHAGNMQDMLASSAKTDVRVEVQRGQEASQQFLNPDDQNGRQGHQQERRRQPEQDQNPQDFIQRLRLGLTTLEPAAS